MGCFSCFGTEQRDDPQKDVVPKQVHVDAVEGKAVIRAQAERTFPSQMPEPAVVSSQGRASLSDAEVSEIYVRMSLQLRVRGEGAWWWWQDTRSRCLRLCVLQVQVQLLQLQAALTCVSGSYINKIKGCLEMVVQRFGLGLAAVLVHDRASSDFVSLLRAGNEAPGLLLPGHVCVTYQRTSAAAAAAGANPARATPTMDNIGQPSKLDSIVEQRASDEKLSAVTLNEHCSSLHHMLVAQVRC